jgi:hypothetical protein
MTRKLFLLVAALLGVVPASTPAQTAPALGLVLYQEDLPHAMQACGGPVTVRLGMLSGFGTNPRLINAITAATRAAP